MSEVRAEVLRAEDKEPLADLPTTVRVLPAGMSLKHCSVELPSPDEAQAGQPCSFCVRLQDQYGNRCAPPPINTQSWL